MIPKNIEDLADAMCEIEKELQHLKTRTDEKFIGIDGRLKATDIKISEQDKYHDRKLWQFLMTGFAGLITLIAVMLSMKVNAADTTITTTTTNTSTNQNTSTSTNRTTMDYKNQPVQRANAPTISVSNNDVCVAGVSGGAQGNAIGISFGTTITDPNCERIKLARELRNANMKVASVSILCQDPRVFQAMIDSGTPCPFKGLIGDEARDMWNKYPELRADYQNYLKKIDILVQAGYMDRDGNMLEKANAETDSKFKSSSDNWN